MAASAAHATELLAAAHLPFDNAQAACTEASRDFGRIASGCAHAIVRPENSEQLTTLVRLARSHGLRLTMRGAGLSQSGQAVAREGLAVDMSQLRAIGEPDMQALSIPCEPGATWRALLTRVAPLGLSPRVMPLNLDLTLGGTLSAGGIGSNSHRHGLCVSNVRSLEVVLGTGEVVRCSPTLRRDVYDSVLGGLGRTGIIRSVDMGLAHTAPVVRTYYLLYPDALTLLADQQRLTSHSEVEHLESFLSCSVHGLHRAASGRRQALRRWHYCLQVTLGHVGEGAADAQLLAGLQHERVLLVEDDSAVAFAARFDVRFEAMRAMGHWDQAHPWLEAFIPARSAPEVIQRLQELPAFLGDGHRIVSVAQCDRPAAVAMPERDALVVAILPTGVPDALRAPALQALRAFDDHIRAVGGKRYLSGWLFGLGHEIPWSEHYGPQYARLSALQAQLDPDRIFGSCLASL